MPKVLVKVLPAICSLHKHGIPDQKTTVLLGHASKTKQLPNMESLTVAIRYQSIVFLADQESRLICKIKK